MTSSSKILRNDIQILRGISVLSVIIFHINEKLFSLGHLGVDVFFVISGFVIVPKLISSSEDWNFQKYWKHVQSFYLRRFWRLFPPLTLAIMLSLIFIFALIPADQFKLISSQAFFSITMLGNFGAYKVVGNYFHNPGNPLLHMWSLGVEAQIYLFLPLVFLFLQEFFPKRLRKYAIPSTVAFLSFVSIVLFHSQGFSSSFYQHLGFQDTSNLSFYSPINRFWEFGVGGLAALFVHDSTRKKPSISNRFLLLGLIFICTLILLVNTSALTVVVVLLATAYLVYGNYKSGKTFVARWFVWIGNRSYSIYLIHLPLIFIAANSPYFAVMHGNLRNAILTVAGLLSLFVGDFIYRVSELRVFKAGTERRNLDTHNLKRKLWLWNGISLSIASTMLIGANSNYWGLSSTPQTPKVGWEIDPACAIMSKPPLGPCIYNQEKNSKSVLLIGDSHAAQFSDVVKKVATNQGWNAVVWTMAGCAVIFQQDPPQISEKCLTRNLQIYQWIRTNRPDMVIVSQYNGYFLDLKLVQEALLSIQPLTKKVVLIGNTPVFPDARFMQTTSILGPSYNAPKSYPIRKMDSENSIFSRELLNWARGEGMTAVDLNSLWCDSQKCIRFSKGKWLWSDRDHLSASGARIAEPRFAALLQ
jgi:peptidoglycan/LPS O-acetylase OafA/YrhL